MPATLPRFGLYRENPFRLYFEGAAFDQPKLDETRKPRAFPSEEAARAIMKHLHERTFVAKLSYLRQRIKYDYSR